MKNIKQTFLLIAFVFTILVSCTNIGKQQNMENVSQSDKEAICRTLELYMEGSRQGDSNITAKAFANEATLSGIYEGRFMVVPIQVLYDLVDQGAKDAKYTLTTCSVENNIAIVRIEAQFGAKQYTDMFTLVKDGNDWKIISKVYHLH